MQQLLTTLRRHAHIGESEEREEHWRHETGAWIECLCNGLLWYAHATCFLVEYFLISTSYRCRDKVSDATVEREKLRESMRTSSSSGMQMHVIGSSKTAYGWIRH